MSFRNCEIDTSNVACELYFGINSFCTCHCADKMVNDLYLGGLDDDDFKEAIKTACSMLAQDKWNRLIGLLKQLPALRDWRLRAAHNAHKPDGKKGVQALAR